MLAIPKDYWDDSRVETPRKQDMRFFNASGNEAPTLPLIANLPRVFNVSTGTPVIEDLCIVSRRSSVLGNIFRNDTPCPDSHIRPNYDILDKANIRPNVNVISNSCRMPVV